MLHVRLLDGLSNLTRRHVRDEDKDERGSFFGTLSALVSRLEIQNQKHSNVGKKSESSTFYKYAPTNVI